MEVHGREIKNAKQGVLGFEREVHNTRSRLQCAERGKGRGGYLYSVVVAEGQRDTLEDATVRA